jgi:hypothetical protein
MLSDGSIGVTGLEAYTKETENNDRDKNTPKNTNLFLIV